MLSLDVFSFICNAWYTRCGAPLHTLSGKPLEVLLQAWDYWQHT